MKGLVSSEAVATAFEFAANPGMPVEDLFGFAEGYPCRRQVVDLNSPPPCLRDQGRTDLGPPFP